MTIPRNFTFSVSGLSFVALDEPLEPRYDGSSDNKYQVAVPVVEVPVEARDLMPNAIASCEDSPYKLWYLTSNTKPMLFDWTDDGRDIAELRRRIGLMNIPLARALRGLPAQVVCATTFRKTAPSALAGWGLVLVAVRIDGEVALRRLPTWDQVAAGGYP